MDYSFIGIWIKGMQIYKFQYSVLIKRFNVIGLHTVRYTDHEWSGELTDLSIDQRLKKAAKSPRRLSGGLMRSQGSANKLWTTLNQMAQI